jgi:hypothetical protein
VPAICGELPLPVDNKLIFSKNEATARKSIPPYMGGNFFCGEFARQISTGGECLGSGANSRTGVMRIFIAMGGVDSFLSTFSTVPTTITIPYKYIYTT